MARESLTVLPCPSVCLYGYGRRKLSQASLCQTTRYGTTHRHVSQPYFPLPRPTSSAVVQVSPVIDTGVLGLPTPPPREQPPPAATTASNAQEDDGAAGAVDAEVLRDASWEAGFAPDLGGADADEGGFKSPTGFRADASFEVPATGPTEGGSGELTVRRCGGGAADGKFRGVLRAGRDPYARYTCVPKMAGANVVLKWVQRRATTRLRFHWHKAERMFFLLIARRERETFARSPALAENKPETTKTGLYNAKAIFL